MKNVFRPVENLVEDPQDLTSGDWTPKNSAKASTFATLHIGHEIEPNRVVLMGFTGELTEPSISWQCPCCKDIIKYKKGNTCKCGRSNVVKIKRGLWVQFSVENSCLVPMSTGGAKK